MSFIQASDVFLWIYKPMHRTNLFIVNGTDLEMFKKNLNLMVNIKKNRN